MPYFLVYAVPTYCTVIITTCVDNKIDLTSIIEKGSKSSYPGY